MQDKIVFPGEFLITAEEFIAGKNTYEDISGKIFAATIGIPNFDSSKREVSVEKPGREIGLLDANAIVEGIVILVKPQAAIVEIRSAESAGKKLHIQQSIGAIPISLVSRAYVASLEEKFKIGDLVRARVAAVTKYGIDLATDDSEFGVIRAYCSKCRNAMGLFESQLKCTNCSNSEQRKLSSAYTLKY